MLQVAEASVLGREHIGPGRNNQDATYYVQTSDYMVAVVCDGCGSGKNSEVGAKIGARLVVDAIVNRIALKAASSPGIPQTFEQVESIMEWARKSTIATLTSLAYDLGDSFKQAVEDYLLFTVVGAVVTKSRSWLFCIGDGVMYLDGDKIDIGVKDGSNAPPYLAYAMVESKIGKDGPKFTIYPMPTFKHALIGTDGVEELIAAEDKNIPGSDQKVGPVSQYWTDDKFFKNPDALRRHLAMVNREKINPKTGIKEFGYLRDDTSLIVLRNTP
jgi:hypothetical protein